MGRLQVFYGTIYTIYEEKQILSITVLIFGRISNGDINYSQVNKK